MPFPICVEAYFFRSPISSEACFFRRRSTLLLAALLTSSEAAFFTGGLCSSKRSRFARWLVFADRAEVAVGIVRAGGEEQLILRAAAGVSAAKFDSPDSVNDEGIAVGVAEGSDEIASG